MVTKEEIEKVRVTPIMCFCPFCGSYDIDPEGGLVQADGWQGPKAFPVCDKCGATAPSVEVWNKRTVTHDFLGKMESMLSFVVKRECIENALNVANHSVCDLATYAEVAEFLGCETTLDYEQLKTTTMFVQSERGMWVNLKNGYFQHIRTAEYQCRFIWPRYWG